MQKLISANPAGTEMLINVSKAFFIRTEVEESKLISKVNTYRVGACFAPDKNVPPVIMGIKKDLSFDEMKSVIDQLEKDYKFIRINPFQLLNPEILITIVIQKIEMPAEPKSSFKMIKHGIHFVLDSGAGMYYQDEQGQPLLFNTEEEAKAKCVELIEGKFDWNRADFNAEVKEASVIIRSSGIIK